MPLPQRRRRRRAPRPRKVPRNPTRRANSPQSPRAVELFLALAYRRAVSRIGNALWARLEPLLSSIGKQDDRKLDAPPPDDARGAIDAARKIVSRMSDQIESSVDASSKVAAARTDRHAGRELARLGIKLSEAAPEVAKLVPIWRKENVARITGMVDDRLSMIEKILEDGDGMRVETIAKEIARQCKELLPSRAELIARDQVLTLNSQITTARMKDAGVEEFVWTTSGDERVRESHEEIDGQTFRYDDPPEVDGEVALPGEPILCRCTAFPVLPELKDE